MVSAGFDFPGSGKARGRGFLIIGLVRNPIDTIYSHFERWKSIPALVEKQWIVSYQNLLRFRDLLPEKTIIMRYEDMVSQPKVMEPILGFCGISANEAAPTFFTLAQSKNGRRTDGSVLRSHRNAAN